MLKSLNISSFAQALLAVLCIFVASCGQVPAGRKSSGPERSSEFFVKVRPVTPVVQNIAGFPAGGFVIVAQSRRCAELESFISTYHHDFLNGLQLSDIKGKCTASALAVSESIQLDFSLSRSPEQLNFRIQIVVEPTGKISFAFNKIKGESLEAWNPRSEKFILHLNMCHIEASLARWIGIK